MTSRRTLRFGLFAVAALATACGASSSDSGSGAPNGGGGGAGEDGGTSNVTITFAVDLPFIYVPGEPREIPIRVSPEGTYSVRLSLVGDSRDAFLDQGEIQTAADGTGRVSLTTPTSPASFGLRASTEGASAVLDASSGTEFGEVEVTPLYAGHRLIDTWTATVRTGLECSTPGIPPPDGFLQAKSWVFAKPVIQNVPADVPLTVTVRAGFFAGGCAELLSAAAGRKTGVTITVNDRALQLAGLHLPIALGLDVTQETALALSALADRMTSAFLDGSATEIGALLDAMQAAAPLASRDAFATARGAAGWDGLLTSSATAFEGMLRSALGRWTATALPPSGDVIMTGTLDTTDQGGTLTVSKLLGQDPSKVGFSTSAPVSVGSEAGDRLLLGGPVSFEPSHLVAAMTTGPAVAEVPSASTVPGALAEVLPCTDVATSLVDGTSGVAYAGCDAACVEKLCETALDAMWSRAREAEADPTPMDVATSGDVTRIDDSAHPLYVTGTWVGTTTLGGSAVKLGGTSTVGTAE